MVIADVGDEWDALSLLADTIGRPRWQARAACRGVGPATFFVERGQSVAEAHALCGRCPVTAECLEFAVANNEKFGIWGDVSERQRRRLRMRRAS